MRRIPFNFFRPARRLSPVLQFRKVVKPAAGRKCRKVDSVFVTEGFIRTSECEMIV